MENKIYIKQSRFSDPGKYKYLFDNLPDTIAEIVSVVQGIIVDKDLLDLYDAALTSEQREDLDSRYTEVILERIISRNNKPLTKTRSFDKRFVGSCRDYALVLCSILRYKGIPARLRCGFDYYFNIKPELYDDHWVCEYWDSNDKRWKLIDANVDDAVKKKYQIEIDTLDIPRDKFITAGRAWQMVRREGFSPDKFGVSSIDIKGLWFIRGSVIRDLAALNRIESLPWDYWGISDKAPEDFLESDLVLLDLTADIITLADDFAKLQETYSKSEFTMPIKIKSYSPFFGLREVSL